MGSQPSKYFRCVKVQKRMEGIINHQHRPEEEIKRKNERRRVEKASSETKICMVIQNEQSRMRIANSEKKTHAYNAAMQTARSHAIFIFCPSKQKTTKSPMDRQAGRQADKT